VETGTDTEPVVSDMGPTVPRLVCWLPGPDWLASPWNDMAIRPPPQANSWRSMKPYRVKNSVPAADIFQSGPISAWITLT